MIKEEEKKKKKKKPGDTRVRTGDLSICSRMLYHWAISPDDDFQVYADIYLSYYIDFYEIDKPRYVLGTAVLMIIKLGHQKRSLYAIYSIILFSDNKSNYPR